MHKGEMQGKVWVDREEKGSKVSNLGKAASLFAKGR